MDYQLFHIFRNTPLGRETLLQSAFFCKTVGLAPTVYIPESTKFLMYFDNDVVQVDLDSSYLTDPETAKNHASEIIESFGCEFGFLEPKHYTASTLPDIPTNFEFMCCPRSISDLSSKIGLGYIGPRVRRIVKSAKFPVLLTSPTFKPWNSIAVLFGGSTNAINAVKLGMRISRVSGKKLTIYTQMENKPREEYEDLLKKAGLADEISSNVKNWVIFNKGRLESNLYAIPHDALVVIGAYGHGLIRDFVFGSKMETIQSVISNNLLIVGPNYTS